ncbi:MAG: hypothetical protein J5804_05130, partial [Eggerthellaceae bacterium]|nr:hypothetical protein [Eggerthellaceae bacterium]
MSDTNVTQDTRRVVYALPAIWFAIACVLISACLALPAPALADVRKADVIMGQTVEERDLSVIDCPDILAEYAYVMDADGTVYFQRDDSAPVPIASITKIMTAVVAIENA